MEHQQLMTIRQLPVIEQQLRSAKKQIQQEIKTALAVECNAQTLPAARKTRAELNRQFLQMEKRRKEIKKAVLSPYEEFEKIYQKEVATLYKQADQQLKERIQSVEDVLKEQKKQGFRKYFNGYAQREGAGWLELEDMNYTVGLSASASKFRKSAREFIDRVVKDLNAISLQDHSSEIFVEYQKTLQLSEAVRTVSERHQAVGRQEELKRQTTKQQLPSFNVEYLHPPQKTNEIYQVVFTVRASKEKLSELKIFLEGRGYEYEGTNTSAKAEI